MEHSRDVEEWAVEAAGEVIAHVERHGLSISWSEAHERLLIEAGSGLMVVAAAGEDDEVHSLVNPKVASQRRQVIVASLVDELRAGGPSRSGSPGPYARCAPH